MPKTGKHYRLSDTTVEQLEELAQRLGITQTEVVQMGVQLLASEHLPSETAPPLRAVEANAGENNTEARSGDEGLARQYDQVADLYEGDEDLKPEFRAAVSRLMRGTAASLRGQTGED